LVSKTVLRAAAFATIAVLAGLPAYLLAERFQLLPPSIRDRPWPLDVVVLLATLGAARAVMTSVDRRGRRLALVCSVASATSLAALVSYAHVTAHALSSASPEVSVGRALPDLTFSDEHGKPKALGSLRGHPTVLLFFRGVFCPACRAQVVKLADRVRPFLDVGVQVLGVSPDPPDACAEWSRTVSLPFPLLSDEQRRLASEVCGATEHCVLIADPQGIVRWGRLNENWRAAARPETVLQSAYRLGRR
jgi:thioredoxin-dependent peroxiredoxin